MKKKSRGVLALERVFLARGLAPHLNADVEEAMNGADAAAVLLAKTVGAVAAAQYLRNFATNIEVSGNVSQSRGRPWNTFKRNPFALLVVARLADEMFPHGIPGRKSVDAFLAEAFARERGGTSEHWRKAIKSARNIGKALQVDAASRMMVQPEK